MCQVLVVFQFTISAILIIGTIVVYNQLRFVLRISGSKRIIRWRSIPMAIASGAAILITFLAVGLQSMKAGSYF